MQPFIDNKYTRIYHQIIHSARQKDYSGIYTEIHHIIPRSMQGSNQADNLVRMSAKEHFLCHLLLVKMTNGRAQRKMIFALNQMLMANQKQDRHRVTSRTYQHIKELVDSVNHFNDPIWQEKHRRKKGYKFDDHVRENMRKGWEKRRSNGLGKPGLGRKHTEETKAKISESRKGKTTGVDNPFYGKTHTDEMKEHFKTRPQNLIPPWTKIKKECPYCNRYFDPGNYSKHHGEKCKSNV